MVRREKRGDISGRRRAAILMVSLGPEIASEVYKHLSDDEIEQITVEVATVGTVPRVVSDEVVEEFYHTALAQEYVKTGGVTMARTILEKALGPQKANDIIGRLQGALTVSPFDFLKKIDASSILNIIANEHPQTIALIVSHLEYEQGAAIISALPPEVQSDVALRIATMDQTTPEVIQDVERVLERKIANVLSQDLTAVGGVEALAELLNRVDRQTEKSIFETMEENSPELAEEIKKLMFLFEDIGTLDDRSIQQILKEVDPKELSIALKGASDEVKERIFRNMSSRAGDMIKEEMEFMGPVRLRNVEEAQQRIVAIVRRLEETGEIVVARGGEEDMMI